MSVAIPSGVCAAMRLSSSASGVRNPSSRKRFHEYTPLSDASMIMFTSNLLDRTGRCPDWACQYLAQQTWKLRILGSAALEATYVAAGVAHGAVTVNGKLWDVAAAAALVLEAGGVMTDLAGKAIFPFDLAHYSGAKVPFLAAGRLAHGPLLKMILDHP